MSLARLWDQGREKPWYKLFQENEYLYKLLQGIILATLLPGSSLFEVERGPYGQDCNLSKGWILLKICTVNEHAKKEPILFTIFQSRDRFSFVCQPPSLQPQICCQTFTTDNTGLVSLYLARGPLESCNLTIIPQACIGWWDDRQPTGHIIPSWLWLE